MHTLFNMAECAVVFHIAKQCTYRDYFHLIQQATKYAKKLSGTRHSTYEMIEDMPALFSTPKNNSPFQIMDRVNNYKE
jgi:hypothetical protein